MVIDQSVPMGPVKETGGPAVVPVPVAFELGKPVAGRMVTFADEGGKPVPVMVSLGAQELGKPVPVMVVFGAHVVGAPQVVMLLVMNGILGVGPYQLGVVGVAEGMFLQTTS